MRAIPQLVSAPLNPIPIAEHFRRPRVEGVGGYAGTLEHLAYTRASSSEFCYPVLD